VLPIGAFSDVELDSATVKSHWMLPRGLRSTISRSTPATVRPRYQGSGFIPSRSSPNCQGSKRFWREAQFSRNSGFSYIRLWA